MAKPATTRTRKPASKPAPKPAQAPAAAEAPAAAAPAAAAPVAPAAPPAPPAPAVVAQQPEPPQAPEIEQGQGVIVVTGPRKGFRRGGVDFGATPVELDPIEFASDGNAGARLLAILTEPRLTCVVRMDDGSEEPIHPDLIGALRAAVAAGEGADA